MKNKIREILNSYDQTVKMGSDGDYEQGQAILSDDFDDLVEELVKKLTIHNVSDSADFRASANPMLKYLNENHHPHVTAIITTTSIELLEGLKNEQKIFDYLID